MTINYSYRGWVFFCVGTQRVQGQQTFWDFTITNNQNADSREFTITQNKVDEYEQAFAELHPFLDTYIDQNGGTIG